MNEIEEWVDQHEEWRDVWTFEPPAFGIKYRVVECEWSDDFTERRILRIELA